MMKRIVWLLSLLLLAWIVLASYLYVCKIRNHCGKQETVILSEREENTGMLIDTPDTALDHKPDSLALALKYLTESGKRTYYFGFASAELGAAGDDDEYISALAVYLGSDTGNNIIIVGHADSRGTSTANDRFAMLRAEAVRTYLVGKGIDGNKISIESRGDTEPAASNDTEEGRRLNRRVEILLN